MAVRNLRSIRPQIWIPPTVTANFKITVERSDGTIDDITDILLMFVIEDGVTEGIGIFEFEIPNPNETYTHAWTGMEIFRFYCDYASGTPTILRFRGRVEKPSRQGNNLKVTGRTESLFVQDQTVTQSYEVIDSAVILDDIFTIYGQDRFDLTDIPVTSGVLMTINWVEKPFWSCVEDICTASGYDCYISADLKVKFFAQGSIVNTTDAIVHEWNLEDTGDFAPDLQFVKNKIRVYGATIDGVQVFYTANDFDSQSANGVRRRTVNDDNILTVAQAKEVGDFELANEKDPPMVGEVKSVVMLATIQPGESLRVSDPLNGIDPGDYRHVKYKHEFGDSGLTTVVTLNKEPKKISHVFKDRIENENKAQDTSSNPNDLDYSYVDTFDVDTGTHDSTAISEGALSTSGAANGTWISDVNETVDGNVVNQVYINMTGVALDQVTIELSSNGGTTYDVVPLKTLTTLTTSIGNDIRIKILIASSTTQINSMVIQYNTVIV